MYYTAIYDRCVSPLFPTDLSRTVEQHHLTCASRLIMPFDSFVLILDLSVSDYKIIAPYLEFK